MRYKVKKEKQEKVNETVNFIPDKRELGEISREACPICKRITPHVRGVCSWHSKNEDIFE